MDGGTCHEGGPRSLKVEISTAAYHCMREGSGNAEEIRDGWRIANVDSQL